MVAASVNAYLFLARGGQSYSRGPSEAFRWLIFFSSLVSSFTGGGILVSPHSQLFALYLALYGGGRTGCLWMSLGCRRLSLTRLLAVPTPNRIGPWLKWNSHSVVRRAGPFIVCHALAWP